MKPPDKKISDGPWKAYAWYAADISKMLQPSEFYYGQIIE